MDFENFTLDADRASVIRANIEKLKNEAFPEDLRLLALELGGEEKTNPNPEEGFFSALKGEKVFIFRTPADHLAGATEVRVTGPELRLYEGVPPASLLELSFLPKGGEFLIFFVNEERTERLLELKALLKDEIKAARARKSERQASMKERFA